MLFAALAALIFGLIFLIWSADYFVDGAVATAHQLGMPHLLVGMLIVGFGTSAPEMIVSAFSALQGNPGLALGNAYGSNVANIALILGVTALLSPIAVHPQVMRRELPLLMGATVFAMLQLLNGEISRTDALLLLAVFFLIMGFSVYKGMKGGPPEILLSEDPEELISEASLPLSKALFKLVIGLAVLMGSSKALVWGAVLVAHALGVSDLIIGLTVVAIGTSLPELASSVAAIRKGKSDIALGNVLGSNLFNTLAVVGIAGVIHPIAVDPEVLSRDCLVMGGLTLLLFAFCKGSRKTRGSITRLEGFLLCTMYASYLGWLLYFTLR
ncbi:MAG TPA: calcium/sodium antiporter [Synergistaceae bacterium]|nr:calcium/sodium antiporter [Synergistaceae bacterium]